MTDDRWALYERKREQKGKLLDLLERTRMEPRLFPDLAPGGEDRPTLAVWLRRPEAKIEVLSDWVTGVLGETPVHGLLATLETEFKYAGYISQQEKHMVRIQELPRAEDSWRV